MCRGWQALRKAQEERSQLEGQTAATLKEQQRYLAWSGRGLIANSVTMAMDGVDQIRAAFLLPQKELKWGSTSCGPVPSKCL
jgi:hypothetical protein